MLQPSVQGWDAVVWWDTGGCTGRHSVDSTLKYEAEPDVAAQSASCPKDRLFPVTCLPGVALLTLRLVMKDALT